MSARNALTAIIAMVLIQICDGKAFGKKLPEDFSRWGLHCWKMEASVGDINLCFNDQNQVESIVADKIEQFSQTGIYRASGGKIIVLGFPGNGWPTKEAINECNYTFEEDGKVMRLSHCHLSGRWSFVR